MAPSLKPLLQPFEFSTPKKNVQSIAESRALICDQLAQDFSAEKNEELAKECRQAATWWRKLPNVPESQLLEKGSYRTLGRELGDALDVLLARADALKEALDQLLCLISHAQLALCSIAREGNKEAAAVLFAIVSSGARDFEDIARERPGLISERAKESFGVPLLVSQNKERQKQIEELVKRLDVGANSPVAIVTKPGRGKTWSPMVPANGLALDLIDFIRGARDRYALIVASQEREKYEIPQWRTEASQLPEFGRNSWEKWFKVAWDGVLAESSPSRIPGEHPAFYDAATQICEPRVRRKDYLGRSITSASLPHTDIKEALRRAFETVATGKSPRSRQKR